MEDVPDPGRGRFGGFGFGFLRKGTEARSAEGNSPRTRLGRLWQRARREREAVDQMFPILQKKMQKLLARAWGL